MNEATTELEINEQYLITNEAQLREKFGDTSESIWAKATDALSKPMKEFIELSPYFCFSSADAQGKTDLSPRGDAPGFVKIANPKHLLVPDRPGNRRYDNIRNIMENGQVSLLFMIPGIPITLRVNGRAQISYDPELLNQFIVEDKAPRMVLIITVEEAYGHCAKAILRGKIWDDDYRQSIKEKIVPSLPDLMTYHRKVQEKVIDDIKDDVKQDLKDSMY